MSQFTTKVSSVSALSRWIHKAPDSTLSKDKARIAFKSVSNIQKELEPISNLSSALQKKYLEEVLEYKSKNPEVDVNKVFPAELQLKQSELNKSQKELSESQVKVNITQGEFLALSSAIDSVLNNMYSTLEKHNKGEKIEEKDLPSVTDYNHIQSFEEDLKAAFENKEDEEKKKK